VFDRRHDLSPGSTIGSQFIGDYPLRRETLLFQQPCEQAFGSLGIAAVLHDLVEHIPVMIDGTP
jgi:hypothetical protein